ncbi:MAG: phosphate ABC transporter substrate-binding protein [Myxococcota bacterium]
MSILRFSWLGPRVLLAAIACFACSDAPVDVAAPGPSALAGKLTLSGSSTLAPLAAEIGKRFEASHPGVRIDVQTGGSSRGIADAHSGRVDIGMSSRALTTSEGAATREHVVARDGVAFAVHADNPVQALSGDQLLAIYRGELTRWSEVGGDDAPIVVVDRAEGRSELSLVADYFGVVPSAFRAGLVCGETQHCVKTLVGNPYAIAYLSVGAAEFERDRGAPLRLLALDGVPASRDSVASGAYPLGRPLLFVTRASSPLSEAFLALALSPEVADLVSGQAFVAPR